MHIELVFNSDAENKRRQSRSRETTLIRPSLIGRQIRANLFATSKWDHQFDTLISTHRSLLDHEYQCGRPGEWWCITFAPFDNAYSKNLQWFQSPAWLEACRRRYQPIAHIMIMTVEKMATKHHVNLLIKTDEDLSSHHGKKWNGKCPIHCEPPRVGTYHYMYYIFKEAKEREFIYNTDYYSYTRPPFPPQPEPDESQRDEEYATWLGHLNVQRSIPIVGT